MIKKLLLIFLFCLLPFSALAVDYYVDADITDNNPASATPDCTNYNPTTELCSGGSDDVFVSIADLEALMATLTSDAASATVNVYFDSSDSWVMTGGDDQFNITCYGTPGNWINFIGDYYGGGTRAEIAKSAYQDDRPIIDADYGDGSSMRNAYTKYKGLEIDGRNAADNGVRIENASYVTFEDVVIHDLNPTYYGVALLFQCDDNVAALDITEIIVTESEIYNINMHAFAVYPSSSGHTNVNDTASNITVTKNKFYNWNETSNYDYGCAMQIMSLNGGTIAQNTLYDANGRSSTYGINLEERGGNGPNNVDVYQNIIYGGAGGDIEIGIEVDNGTNVDIYSNIIYSINYIGILFENTSTGNIVGNTLYNIQGNSIDYAMFVHTNSIVSNITNNIVYQTTDDHALGVNGTVSAHINNLYYSSLDSSDNAVSHSGTYTYASFDDSYEVSGVAETAPGFLNLSSLPTSFDGDWKMTPTGLQINNTGGAYNAGADAGSPFNVDIDGSARSGSWDIGASEYGVSALLEIMTAMGIE